MKLQWGGIKVSMVPRGFWGKSTMRGFQYFENNKISKNEIYLLNTNDQKADLREVSKNQPQLTEIQEDFLFNLLSKYDNLFQGKLGTWKGPLIHIEIKADVQPYVRSTVHSVTEYTPVQLAFGVDILMRKRIIAD